MMNASNKCDDMTVKVDVDSMDGASVTSDNLTIYDQNSIMQDVKDSDTRLSRECNTYRQEFHRENDCVNLIMFNLTGFNDTNRLETNK